jgi:hypothetical protein
MSGHGLTLGRSYDRALTEWWRFAFIGRVLLHRLALPSRSEPDVTQITICTRRSLNALHKRREQAARAVDGARYVRGLAKRPTKTP